MTKNQIQLGQVYLAKVSGRVVPVQIDAVSRYGGWAATNIITGRAVRIGTAGRLRSHVATPLRPEVQS